MNLKMKILIISILLLLLSRQASAQIPPPPVQQIHGITLEDSKYDVADKSYQSILTPALQNLSIQKKGQKPTIRIVFSYPDNEADYYKNAVSIIKNKNTSTGYPGSDIMGQPVDSSEMADISVPDYLNRFRDYVDTLGTNVDLWEICNECNGDWLGSNVPDKMIEAYNYVKSKGGKTVLTLYMFPSNCIPKNFDMIPWAKANVPGPNDPSGKPDMKNNLDYVLVSYYADSCKPSVPEPDWQSIFTQLHTIFPKAKLGFGEIGWSTPDPPNDNPVQVLTNLINHFYGLQITVPNYIGGYFYWTFSRDMVPWTTCPLWSVIDNAMNKQ
jgi:hypothetical protein